MRKIRLRNRASRYWWRIPVTYTSEKKATPIEKFARALIPLLKPTGLKILFEPGRYMVANASVLLSKVLYIKKIITRKSLSSSMQL